MTSVWTIGINIVSRSNAGMVFGQVGAQARAAEQKIGNLQSAIGKGIPQAAKMANLALNGFAIVAAASFAVGIKGAADLQLELAKLSITLGKTPEAMDKKFMPVAVKYGTKYGTSLSETVKEERVLDTIFKTKKQQDTARPAAFMFANIMKIKDGTSLEKSIENLGKVAHMMGAYDAKSFNAITETLAKKGFASSGKIEEMIIQLGYYAETYSRAGVSPEHIMQSAIYGNLTLPGKYGAAYDQLLKNLVHPTETMAAAQVSMGIRSAGKMVQDTVVETHRVDKHGNLQTGYKVKHGKTHAGELIPGIFDAKGHFDPMMFNVLTEKHTRNKTIPQRLEEFYSAFNVRSNRAALMGANPKAIAYNSALGKAIGNEPGLVEQNRRLMNTLNVQTERLAKNFESMSTLLSKPFIVKFTSGMMKLADMLGDFTNHLQTHPNQAKVGSGVLALGTGIFFFKLASKVRLFIHGFTHAFGVSMKVGSHEFEKDVKEFEKSLSKALWNSISSVGKKIVEALSGKWVLPILEQVNKFGPIGSKIASFALGISGSMTAVGSALSGLVGILGKLAGAPLSALFMVLNPSSIKDEHSADGSLGETQKMLEHTRASDAQGRAARMHRQASVPPPAPTRQGHGGRVAVVNHYHTYNIAAAMPNDAKANLHAIVTGREVAKAVAAVISSGGRTGTRAAGNTPQSAKQSAYETMSAYA